jgi:hypothetical protein
MADIICPECGLVSSLPSIRRASTEFCAHCDFPLFWAPTAAPMAMESTSSDTTLRRLPGAGGRQMIGTRVCPVCGELNSIAEQFCTRCSSDMDPLPEIVPEPVEEIPPPPPPAPVPQKRNWIPWIVFALVTVVVIVVVIVAT